MILLALHVARFAKGHALPFLCVSFAHATIMIIVYVYFSHVHQHVHVCKPIVFMA